eukprot:TRINITY_DN1892_c0_g2_i1.p1 TRINITY_DN1892_c0_g2~~TRINITY_DN1892_c0_g2_i1.p1  ORF type:complete len:306 (+),score=60.32 TRINITY_DN1892_c0_g2_i1:289-1206(+)
MATRNKTDKFVSQRKILKSQMSLRDSDSIEMVEMGKRSSSEAKLIDRDADHRLNIAPNWLSIVDEVKLDLSRIQQKMEELKEAHKKHLLPGFDDRPDEVQAIEIITADVTRLFSQSQMKIQNMSKVKLSSQEKQMRDNLQSSLATKLQDLSMDFRKIQKRYLGQLQTLEKGGDPFKITGDDLVSESPLFDQGMKDSQIQLIDHSVAHWEETERQTRQILSAVTDLTDILKDLALLIVEQGTVLDRIDYNIEHASHDVEQALENVKKAEESQKSTKKKYCMMVLCCLIMAVLVGIVIKAAVGAARI